MPIPDRRCSRPAPPIALAMASRTVSRPAPASTGSGPLRFPESTNGAGSRVRAEPALTFDDVLLTPRHSVVHPKDVSIRSRLTKAIGLNIPLGMPAHVQEGTP